MSASRMKKGRKISSVSAHMSGFNRVRLTAHGKATTLKSQGLKPQILGKHKQRSSDKLKEARSHALLPSEHPTSPVSLAATSRCHTPRSSTKNTHQKLGTLVSGTYGRDTLTIGRHCFTRHFQFIRTERDLRCHRRTHLLVLSDGQFACVATPDFLQLSLGSALAPGMHLLSSASSVKNSSRNLELRSIWSCPRELSPSTVTRHPVSRIACTAEISLVTLLT